MSAGGAPYQAVVSHVDVRSTLVFGPAFRSSQYSLVRSDTFLFGIQ